MLDAVKDALRARWEAFKTGEPGSRFEARYRQRRSEHAGRTRVKRLLYVGGGLLVVLAGLVMMVAPGPGLAAVLVGLSLLGSEFLVIARFMDRSELRLRRGARWSRRMWLRTSRLKRILLALAALLAALALGYAAYHLFFARWL